MESGGLAWATLALSGDRLRRVDSGMEVLPPDTPDQEPDGASSSALEQTRTAFASVKGDFALGLPTTDVLLRMVELPTVESDELAAMVQLQADKFAPFPIDTMAVSHEVLDRGASSSRVLIAAARNDAIDAHARLLIESGRRPATIDCCALGWWRLLQDSGEVPHEGRAALVLCAGNTVELIVMQEGVPLLFRSMEVAPGAAASARAADIGDELSHTLITLELEHGSQACRVLLWADGGQASAIGDALREQRVDVTVTHALDALPAVAEGIARRWITGGGINLTPQAWLEADASAARRRRLLGGLGGVLGVWLLCVIGLLALFGWRKGQIRRLRARQQQGETSAMEVRELRRRVLMIDRYTDFSHSALECLRAISAIQPEGVDLVSFIYTKGDEIRIVGQASERSLIYRFKEALDASGFFPLVELGTQIQDRRRRHWNFDMVLNLPRGEEAA